MKATKFFFTLTLWLFAITLHAQDSLIDLTHLYANNNLNGNVDYYDNDSTNNKPQLSESPKLIQKYADMMKVPVDQISNTNLYAFIDDWYGTPYHYSGTTKKGIDCSSFTAKLQDEIFGKSISGSAASLYNLCKPIKKDDLQEGDLVFFKIGKSYVSHVGVYLMNHYFVHASTQAGVIISNLDEAYYTKYFYGGGRLK